MTSKSINIHCNENTTIQQATEIHGILSRALKKTYFRFRFLLPSLTPILPSLPLAN